MNIIDIINNKEIIIKKHLKKDDILFREKEKCECVGIVTKGKISIISYLDNGNKIIYNTLNENEIFGNNLIFSSEPYYKGDVISLEDSQINLIYKDNLIYLLQNNQSFFLEYMKIQSNFAKRINSKIKLLSFDKAIDRFVYYLNINNNIIQYDSITNLAEELNLERETLSRLISKLEKTK